MMEPATSSAVSASTIAKGDVLAAARIAGIQAAKQTSTVLPSSFRTTPAAVEVAFIVGPGWIDVTVRVADGGPSVQMEAMTACIAAGLTIYDMCKAMDRGMSITAVTMSTPA